MATQLHLSTLLRRLLRRRRLADAFLDAALDAPIYRRALVDDIRRRITTGEYHISADSIADRLLERRGGLALVSGTASLDGSDSHAELQQTP